LTHKHKGAEAKGPDRPSVSHCSASALERRHDVGTAIASARFDHRRVARSYQPPTVSAASSSPERRRFVGADHFACRTFTVSQFAKLGAVRSAVTWSPPWVSSPNDRRLRRSKSLSMGTLLQGVENALKTLSHVRLVRRRLYHLRCSG